MYDLKLDAISLGWSPLDFAGVSMKVLKNHRSGGMTVMTKMEAGAFIPSHSHTNEDENVYVLEGDFIEDAATYGPGSFFSGAAGTVHGPHRSKTGCVLLTTFSAALDFVIA